MAATAAWKCVQSKMANPLRGAISVFIQERRDFFLLLGTSLTFSYEWREESKTFFPDFNPRSQSRMEWMKVNNVNQPDKNALTD